MYLIEFYLSEWYKSDPRDQGRLIGINLKRHKKKNEQEDMRKGTWTIGSIS